MSTPAAAGPAEGAATAGPGAAAAVRTGMHDVTVIIYIGLALAALVPGLALKAGVDFRDHPALAAPLRVLQSTLADIRFGSGVRFWLGVAGATMLGLLLLYPLRKAFAKGSRLGSVGGWFHLHILLGIIGPVLILYHSNFRHGGSDANVALWTMLLVAVSGIAGYFVYGRVSRDFYSTRQQARRHRDAMVAALPALDHAHASKEELVAGLEIFEAELLTPRQGLVASLKARLGVEHKRRELAHAVTWYVTECAHQHGLDRNGHRRLHALVGGHRRAYFALARSAASRSVLEQLWARWRLFHLPVFLIMVGAAVLHVIAVWGMDDAGAGAVQPPAKVERQATLGAEDASDQIGALLNDNTPAPVVALPARQLGPVNSVAAGRDSANDARAGATARRTPSNSAAAETRPVALPEGPVLLVKPQAAAPPQRPVEGLAAKSTPPAGDSAKPDRTAKPAPAALTRSDETVPKPPSEAAPAVKPASRPAAVTMPPPLPVASSASAPPADIAPVYAELERRIEAPPMGLGGARTRTLAVQIADYKARWQTGLFAHSEAETGFQLAGKHLKADCSGCHAAPLREAPSSNPRACITCHKNDDIHDGRRPDCAHCHTANRWRQILRRK